MEWTIYQGKMVNSFVIIVSDVGGIGVYDVSFPIYLLGVSCHFDEMRFAV